jgi:hypothetical protein
MPVIFPDSKLYRSSNSNAALGILVCERSGNPPFAESSFIKRLSLAAASSGMPLFAFAPWTWESRSDCVKGWSWNKKEARWESGLRELPSVVYDRAWPESHEEKQRYRQAMQRIHAVKQLTYLNGRLPHKGKVYDILSVDPTFAALIPPTSLYEGPESLALWLRQNRHTAFLKPIAGSHGKRVIAIIPAEGRSVYLVGRQSDNRSLSINCINESDAIRRLSRWIGNRTYLMQPMLDLRGPRGEPFDIRALMQKNKYGRWTLTGVAARCGSPGTVTSNLHGGGSAASAEEVLYSLFGEQRGNELLHEIENISIPLVTRLEQSLGRFAEIGLDYGVDRSGRLWFLEANSKPGRAAMGSAGKDAVNIAAEQPLVYARSILLRPPGRVIHEFDHL